MPDPYERLQNQWRLAPRSGPAMARSQTARAADKFLEDPGLRSPPDLLSRLLPARNIDDVLVEQLLDQFPMLGLGEMTWPVYFPPDGDNYTRAPKVDQAFPEVLLGMSRAQPLLPSIINTTEGLGLEYIEDSPPRSYNTRFWKYDPHISAANRDYSDFEWDIADQVRHRDRDAPLAGLTDDEVYRPWEEQNQRAARNMASLRQTAPANRSVHNLIAAYHPEYLGRIQDDVINAAVATKFDEAAVPLPVIHDAASLARRASSGGQDSQRHAETFRNLLSQYDLEGSAKLGTIGKGFGGILAALGVGSLARKHTDEESLPGQLVRRIL